MTSKKDSGSRDKKAVKAERNKKTDRHGEAYDRRSGYYGAIDKGIRDHILEMNNWLAAAQCMIELIILNQNKNGRPFVYSPSLILYLDERRCRGIGGYRGAVADSIDRLEGSGLPVPCYKTVQRSRGLFFGPKGVGEEVMEMAAEALAKLHPERIVDDHLVFKRTGYFPPFSAPQKIPVSDEDVEEQKARDAKAALARRSMEVFVNKHYIGQDTVVAVDGSGIGTVGSGLYIEMKWCMVDRSFIKIHAMLDIRDQ